MGGGGKDTRQRRVKDEETKGQRAKEERAKRKVERRYRRSWPVLLVRH